MNKDDREWIIVAIDDKVRHLRSSPETLEQFTRIEKKMSTLEERVSTKVSWQQFIWIVGILTAFMTSMLGAIWFQVRTNGEMVQSSRSDISYIRGILNNADIYEN